MKYTFEAPEAGYAARFVNSTNRHIFLTGKAGTGKTTLLKQLVEDTHKTAIIAAPTGIAAINAGGVTLHSLFHLPFGTFVPSNNPDYSYKITSQINTPQSLIKNLRMNAQKRSLLNEMELLIIDEASMLRADLLDAIDTVLRYTRKKRTLPFGGVQILFIGDLWQLPPIVKRDDVNFLKQFYSNFYFFNAQALSEHKPVYLELKHIYRQTDNDFIQLLNSFRTNTVSSSDLQLLNKQYRPDFKPEDNPGYIFITTHNQKAIRVNNDSIEKLEGKEFSYKATIQGDFNENLYPIEPKLILKEGAQVMFIKNDYSGDKAYFNGKIGKISELGNDFIQVSFNDGSKAAIVEEYTWENKKFRLNKESNELEENIIGKFTHYPIKLAWAITIHKSQGLTFKQAIIDISDVFASGQIYVALSRLTSLKGMVLSQPIKGSGPEFDKDISTFSENQINSSALQNELKTASSQYAYYGAIEAFSLERIIIHLQEHKESYNKDKKKSAKQRYIDWAINITSKVKNINNVAIKFQNQLNKLVNDKNTDALSILLERVIAAKNYFEPIFNEFSKNTVDHITQVNREKGVKKYLSELQLIDSIFYNKILQFNKTEALIKAIIENSEFNKSNVSKIASQITRVQIPNSIKNNTTKEKIDTKSQTFNLYKEGFTIEEIVKERDLAITTIESHLATYVAKGVLPLSNFVDKKKIEPIIEASKEFDTINSGPIKQYLGNDYSYSEIKFVMSHVVYKRFVAEKEKK